MTIFTGRTGKLMGWPDVCVSPQLETELNAIGVSLGRGMDSESIERTWISFMGKAAAEIAGTDDVITEVNKLVQYVLTRFYEESHNDLQRFVSKVQHFNEIKQAVRGLLESLREKMRALEDEYAATDEEVQLANIDLQNALQTQQQTLQSLNSVSKMLHDTAMAVIRNIGGYDDEERKLKEELALLREALLDNEFPVVIGNRTYTSKEELEARIAELETRLSQL